jgi:hypothetical protein
MDRATLGRTVIPRRLARVGLLLAPLLLLAARTDAASDDLLGEQLAAGEFAPAIAAAENTPGPERDRRLTTIAAAQAATGDRSSALSTVADIGADRDRSAALNDVMRQPLGGGGIQPDFDSLIELLTSTIAPTTWSEVGGTGAVKQFPTGVYVDPQGVLHRTLKTASAKDLLLAMAEPPRDPTAARDVRRVSTLRKVSLPRLEKEIQLRLAAGKPLADEMLLLAGLERVEYIFVDAEHGDLIIAGPAGDWRTDTEGRIVSSEGGHPIVRLEDLVVLLRHALHAADMRFGCAITPTQEGLARTQAFARESSQKPLKSGKRGAWLEELRQQLGRQKIEVHGIDPHTRVAQVLVEADYRMKLVGIGLEEGTLGVPSYLSMIQVPAGGSPPPLDVLRWWFAMNYKSLIASADHHLFQIRGTGIKVLSENELLTEQGQRVHTGDSDLLNREFAHNFTEHFDDLAVRYPVYGELRSVFDLALVAALIKSEGLAEQVGWHLTCFDDERAFPVSRGTPPQEVDTVANHRVVGKVHILAAVSGGVAADPATVVERAAIQVDTKGRLPGTSLLKPRASLASDRWWWD